jgi:DNA-binding CsgD family transcriptional regulator
LPGKRSQQRGEIVEIKELRNKPGQYYPVAVLENGRKLFVSEDVTALDKSAVIDEKHQRQVLQLIRNVGEIGIKHNDLARTLFKAKIPGLKNIVKALVKDKLVKRRHTSTGAVYYVPPADDLGLNPVAIQIYRRIAQGVSRDDIAKELGLCAQSVYYHEKRVRVMLDVDDTNGVIQRLKAAGLLG